MPRYCRDCNRPIKGSAWSHVCDMIQLSDGRIVHRERVDNFDGDVRKEIEKGQVKVKNRWIKEKQL